jgi:hypothetical protein
MGYSPERNLNNIMFGCILANNIVFLALRKKPLLQSFKERNSNVMLHSGLAFMSSMGIFCNSFLFGR